MATLNPFRNDGIPEPRLETAKLVTFFNLDVSELLALGVFWFLAPILCLAAIPDASKFLAIAGFLATGALLYLAKLDERNLAYWVSKLLPFWLRQRRFRARRAVGRVTPETERIDMITSYAGNSLSYERREGSDGVVEWHVYEHPLRPYRGWIADPRPSGRRRVRLPGTSR